MISGFLEIFGPYSQFPEGGNALFASPADVHGNVYNRTQNSIMFIITFDTILNDQVG